MMELKLENTTDAKKDEIVKTLDMKGVDGSMYTCEITLAADEKIRRTMKRMRYGYERALEKMLRDTKSRWLANYRGFKVVKTKAQD